MRPQGESVRLVRFEYWEVIQVSEQRWHVGIDGKSDGPFSDEDIRAGIESGKYEGRTLIFTKGMETWRPLEEIPELAGLLKGGRAVPAGGPPPLPAAGPGADEIDYFIYGEEMQFVEVELDPGESAVAEAGMMMYMTSGITMETIFGDGRASRKAQGVMDKLLGAGKRLLTGESLFMTVFSNTRGQGKERVAFAAPYAGKIIPLHLTEYDGEVVCQKDAFLCAAKGVALEISFQKKLGVGLFGGEGFIMQKLLGDGWTFLHAGGTVIQKDLGPGETIRLDTGCLVALTRNVKYDVEFVGGIKSSLFGGEGLFWATLTGPGHVWLQSLPLSRLADRIYSAAPQTGGSRKGEGSVLDGFGKLGRLISGD